MVIQIHTDGQDPDAWQDKREPLFTIDEAEYTIPVEVPGNITLQALESLRQHGEAHTTAWLLELMLGEDGYRALRQCPSVTRANLAQIGAVVSAKVLGDLEDVTGK
jgi:hypothetical protein